MAETMDLYDIIEKKRRGQALSHEEISFFVKGVTCGEIEDYKASSLLMAIALIGMTQEETNALTSAMLESGSVMDLSEVSGVLADKHSTGGVSDSTTLVLTPVLAALGVKVAKMSGRSLGHTGGTVDKLESFPGYRTDLSRERFIEIVNSVGASVMGQTGEMVPADKKLYALRDLTATVDSVPLIASSIMSKKLATGVEHILLDVKYGSGAFMKQAKDAVRLARCMVQIGADAGRDVQAVVSRMNQPLGNNIGCNLEVREAIEVLKGREGDLLELSRFLAGKILVMCGVAATREQAKELVDGVIADGSALTKLREMVEAHEGDASALDDPELLPVSQFRLAVKCGEGGTVTAIDAEKLGRIVSELGGGRKSKDDEVDHTVGIEMLVRVDSAVEPDSEIAVVYAPDEEKLAWANGQIADCVSFHTERENMPLIYAYLTKEGTAYDGEIAKKLKLEGAVMDYEKDLDREAEQYKYRSVVERIEHTLLNQTANAEKIKQLCDEASEYHFASVCVMPTHVAEAVKFLGVNSVKVCTVVGFPYGEDVTAVKVAAAKAAVKSGAGEIDMVMCVSKAKQGNWKYVTKEIAKVVAAAKKRTVKVIIETSLLTEDEIRKSVKAVTDAKADYVKTSTGLFGGATAEAVKLIKDELEKLHPVKATGIKASGGIKTKQDAFAMLYSGATRIGTSHGIEIAQEIKKDLEQKLETIGKSDENV